MAARAWIFGLGLVALGGGCNRAPLYPRDLELVEVSTQAESPRPTTLRLAARGKTPGDGTWRIPVPTPDRYQAVRTLIWEVTAPARTHVERTADGQRILTIDVPEQHRGELTLRVVCDRHAPQDPNLPWRVPADRGPEAQLEALRAKGATARLAFGLDLADDHTTPCRWPEVFLEDHWVAVDTDGAPGLPPTRLRLGTEPLDVSLLDWD